MVNRFIHVSLLFLATNILQTATAQDKVQSGLQPGDKTFAFHVQDVTGPRKGKTLCYACAFGKHAVVNIQTRKVTDELINLLTQLDGMVANAGKIKGDSKHAFLVYLTEDPDVASEELVLIDKKHKIKNIPLTIYDELTGPKPYKLSDDAEITIMMWKDTKVTANHAYASAKLGKQESANIIESAKKLLTE